MPRTAGGAYEVPAGTEASAGTIIESAKYNSLLADLEQELSDSLSRSGKGSMLADLNLGGFDLLMDTGGKVIFGGSDVVIQHSANLLSFTGATSGYDFDDNVIATGLFIDEKANADTDVTGQGQLWVKAIDTAPDPDTPQKLMFTGSNGVDLSIASLNGTETFTNKTFTAPIMTTPAMTDPVITGAIQEDIYSVVDAIGVEIDPGNGSIQRWTLTASRTPKATNFVAGESMTLEIADGTLFAVTWTDATWGGSGVAWVGEVAPTLPTTGWAVVELWKISGQVYGSHAGNHT